jgi:hypothetical protein
VRHDIDLPSLLPGLVRRGGGIGRIATKPADAGIGAEQVDRPNLGFDRVDQAADVGVLGNVTGERAPTREPGGFNRAGKVQVGRDNGFRPGSFCRYPAPRP